jgi:hypothetical protein
VKTDSVPVIPIKEEPKPIPETPTVTHLESEEESKPENSVKIYCLPAYYETHKDELYDETSVVLKYGSKFLFDGVILEQNDFSITLWANIENIEKKSIIYPKTHDKRWWKIIRKEEKSIGHIYVGTPSDIHPDFT